MNNKRSTGLFLTLLILFILTVATVAAANPHFIRASADIDKDGNLVVSWKEAGLGNNQLIDYLATADASGFYACINRGGNHPQASNKEDFAGPVSETGTFNSGKNGQITESLTVSPPASTLDCPGNQRLVLACVTYSNIALKDTTNNIDAGISGSLSETLYAIEECP